MKTDLELRRDVETELAWNPKLDAGDVAVVAKNGSYWKNSVIEQTAKQVYGVRGVANDVKVQLDVAQDDSDLLQNASRALERDVSVPEGAIKPIVNNAWVTLKGKVKWNFEREAAEDAVCKLPGVKGVFNEIIIEQRPLPKDVSKLVSDALARNAHIDARSIKVTAKGSTVVLDGSVRSLAERDEAEGAASRRE